MADQAQGEYKHGSMDISAKEKTFSGFLHLVAWAIALAFAVLIFAALADG